MRTVLLGTNADARGGSYVDAEDRLSIRPRDGQYVVYKKVRFGDKPKKGLKIHHVTIANGTTLVEVRLDRLDGPSLGVVACSFADACENGDTVWGEITPVSGTHDVYLVFTGGGTFRQFEFTDDSPYAVKEYTQVPEETMVEIGADCWEATDMLGRKVPSAEDCPAKKEKYVGIFYWTWKEQHCKRTPVNVTKVLERAPEAEYDMKHPLWEEKGSDIICHWGEPFYGYYRNSDPYVIRKHAVLLANAGVDFLMFDTTNGSSVKKDGYVPLLEGLYEAKRDGINVPKIAFMMNFGPGKTSEYMLRSVYQDLYKPGLYQDLWFLLDGKPLVMCYPESLPEQGVNEEDTKLLNEIRNFFTFRPGQPRYKGGPTRPDQWGWLECYPQNKYVEAADGSCEMVTVGVGQNQSDDRICTHFNAPNTYGRSYTGQQKFDLLTEDSYKYGYNVQEQWDRAIELDPKIVFLTGWNEWVMGRWTTPWIKEEGSTQIAFVDQFNREYSRDIELDRDGYKDSYYLQMCANIRRFKGTASRPKASEEKTIDLEGCFCEQWGEVQPVYRNPKNSNLNRDYPGCGTAIRYLNRTARNDIVEAKAARDSQNLYFSARTSAPLQGAGEDNFMVLYLDTDRNKETGWEGYDYRVVNGRLEKHTGGFQWEKIADVPYRAVCKQGDTCDKIQLSIPRERIGLEGPLDFEFKWSDNLQTPDAMDFYEHGCAAPIGRFNYRYIAE